MCKNGVMKIGYIQSFRRCETKYMLTEKQADVFMYAAKDILCSDRYTDYTISNIYIDTDDYYFIKHSLDKPIYKEKLRLRCYGTADDNSTVFLEIKKKYRGIVYKRRITIPHHEAEQYIYSGIRPASLSGYSSNQIFSEIDYLFKKYSPSPKLFLAYDRMAYYMKENPDVRITFDTGIRSRQNELSLKNGDHGEYLDTGTANYRLMELKFTEAVPLEITKILSALKIYPVSFSKYGRIYTDKIYKCDRKEISI